MDPHSWCSGGHSVRIRQIVELSAYERFVVLESVYGVWSLALMDIGVQGATVVPSIYAYNVMTAWLRNNNNAYHGEPGYACGERCRRMNNSTPQF